MHDEDYKRTENLCTNEIRVEADEVIDFSDGSILVHDDDFNVSVHLDEEGEPEKDLYDEEDWQDIVEEKDIADDFERDERKPVNWCNGAGVSVGKNSVNVWISVGDPRGAMGMKITKTQDGELILEVPTENEMHVKLERKSEGMFRVV